MVFARFVRQLCLLICGALLPALVSCTGERANPAAGSLVTRNDFEAAAGWSGSPSISQAQAHSGRYSVKVSAQVEFSYGYSSRLGLMPGRQPKKLKMAGWFLVPAGADGAALVLELRRPAGEQRLQWTGLDLAAVVREKNKWTYAEQVVTLPAGIEFTDRCLLYLWRGQATAPVYADDLELSVVEPAGTQDQSGIGVLAVGSVLLAVSSAVSFARRRGRLALVLLIGAAGLARAAVAMADPFLHDWDERFHALVAKHLMANPGRPVLRANPILPYKIRDWSTNHVWLHKPPLFLWQIALSLALFGISELAVRLPAIVLGALLVVPVFGLGNRLFGKMGAYAGALLAAFAYYDLELTAGVFVADQNDASFVFYVTLSLWAYVEYVASGRSRRWVWLIGAAVGAAILTKWLTGLLVFAGWGLTLLLTASLRRSGRAWADLALAAGLALALALPWTFYTHWAFPQESAWEQAYNFRHIFEVVEGHDGPPYFYLAQFGEHYGHWAWLPLLVGLAAVIRQPRAAAYRTAVGTWLVVVYGFFSLVAQTKMSSFVYCLGGLLYALMGGGLTLMAIEASRWLRRPAGQVLTPVLLLGTLYSLHWPTLRATHSRANAATVAKRGNTEIYRKLDWAVPPGYVVLNAVWREDIDAMFYSDRTVYGSCPDERTYRALKAQGVRFAAFDSSSTASLPAYIRRDPDVRHIPVQLH